MELMKAIHYGNRKIEVVEVPVPQPKEGELLVKILASAVCGSEKMQWEPENMYEGFTNSGHEAIGEVVDANGSLRFKNGDRVCIQNMAGCGECPACRKGFYSACRHKKRKSYGGCHSQYVAMPEVCFIRFDEDIPVDVGTLLGGDCLGLSNRATSKLQFEKNDWVFVCGAGPVGLGNIFTLKHLGARVVTSDPSPIRRQYAIENAGADLALDPTEQDVKAELMKLAESTGPVASIECSGTVEGETLCIDATRLEGDVCFCGENIKGLTIVPTFQLIHREMNIHGASYFRVRDVEENVRRYRAGMDPEALISNRVRIDDAPKVMDDFFHGRTGGKVIIYSNDEPNQV